MPKSYIVKITEQAQKQIREITHYITYELESPDAALHLLDKLQDAIASLSLFPQRVALTDEEPWRSNGVHRLPAKNFLIYFWVDEDNLKEQRAD
jgi:toxin ParE1/3/4